MEKDKTKRILFIAAFIFYIIVSIIYLVFVSIFVVDFSDVIGGTEIIGHISGVIIVGVIIFGGWYYIEMN